MKTSHLSVIVSLIALCSVNGFAQDSIVEGTQVVIQVTDSLGEPLPITWRIVSFRDEYGKDWAQSFETGGRAVVAPGAYSLRVESDLFLPFEGRVFVWGMSTIYKVGLKFAGIENVPPEETVYGRFELPPGDGCWCKLSGLYTSDSFFAIVAEDGSFRFHNVPYGSYVLACLKAKKSLETRVVDVIVSKTPEIIVHNR